MVVHICCFCVLPVRPITNIFLHLYFQVVADTNISAIASQLESMSAGCNLNTPSDHHSEDSE